MEVKKVEKQRNCSLDLLRVIAILMIIIFHVCYKALIFNNLSGFNKLIVAFFLHFGEIGVNLFMLITGFFCIKVIVLKLQKSFVSYTTSGFILF